MSAPRVTDPALLALLRTSWRADRATFARALGEGPLDEDHPHVRAALGSPGPWRAADVATPGPVRGWSPLVSCLLSKLVDADRRRAMAAALLEAGDDPNAAVPDGDLPGGRRSVLALAVEHDDVATTALLLERGAEPADGAARFVASTRRRWGPGELLVAGGPSWDDPDPRGRWTPLGHLLDA